MKKILLTLWVFLIGIMPLTWNWQGMDELFYDVDTSWIPSASVTWTLHDDIVDEPNGFVQRLLEVMWLDRFASGTDPLTGETRGATNFIAFIINVALSLAGLIALVVLLYGFAMMLFTSEEDWIAKAKKYIFGAALAIFILGLSWFITSFIFYIFNTVSL